MPNRGPPRPQIVEEKPPIPRLIANQPGPASYEYERRPGNVGGEWRASGPSGGIRERQRKRGPRLRSRLRGWMPSKRSGQVTAEESPGSDPAGRRVAARRGNRAGARESAEGTPNRVVGARAGPGRSSAGARVAIIDGSATRAHPGRVRESWAVRGVSRGRTEGSPRSGERRRARGVRSGGGIGRHRRRESRGRDWQRRAMGTKSGPSEGATPTPSQRERAAIVASTTWQNFLRHTGRM